MSSFSDQNGKSNTNAMDGEHTGPSHGELPTYEEIAERAHQLWLQKGRPSDSREEDWLEAERELHDAALSRRLTQLSHEKGGSVQS